jgi:hypothetical protein
VEFPANFSGLCGAYSSAALISSQLIARLLLVLCVVLYLSGNKIRSCLNTLSSLSVVFRPDFFAHKVFAIFLSILYVVYINILPGFL